ncbi:hypothetical protein M406DRAFT_72297 [Cryphonectria parasitica EP155]|uniref:Transcription factor domain-containing protein n=1 Tax=Cryphonectria parasitica (strain ATCC 38755 / EP155) TaxID=660469 RepID=A0A9P4XWS5_CRYP1|nr:uncharacterized protein M406DRAFT_72297 [Cryphonectria parasitica EP155]KAF3762281.1 hypothetical protein M406DRAFT_72297 [Cryphonectria parasitica EP155]
MPKVSDEDLLAFYQMRLTPQFPFVIIPRGTKADQLKADRPFLFAAIKMAASLYDVRSIRGQMYQLVDRVTKELLISSTRSLDLLQAILVMLAWFHNHCVMHGQLSSLIHLAQALVADMCLNQEPVVQERTSVMVLAPLVPPPRNADDKRAVLGVWFLTSYLHTSLQKLLPMKFSKYLKKCLRELEEAPEAAFDQLLVHLVKIQHLTEQVHNFLSNEDEDEDVLSAYRTPTLAGQSAFEQELRRLQQSLPSTLKDNKLLKVHYASAVLRIYQPPPVELPLLQNLADSFATISNGRFSTLDVFYRARAALQGFFDTFLSLPTEFYTLMPIYTMLHILSGVTMLARWAKVMGPGRTRSSRAPPDILTPQKVIWDPSARRPNPATLFGAGFPAPPSFEERSTTCATSKSPAGERTAAPTCTDSPSASSGLPSPAAPANATNPVAVRCRQVPPLITDPAQIPACHIRETSDPNIPRAVATLKAKLHSQPGLNLDIVGLLTTLAQRCEEAHNELERYNGGVWQNDIWCVCAKKVLIARAKLEKFSEIMAAGGVSEMLQKCSNNESGHDVQAGDGAAPPPPPPPPPTTTTTTNASRGPKAPVVDTCGAPEPVVEEAAQSAVEHQAMYDEAMMNDFWMDNAFDSLDPNLWPIDDGDWGLSLPPEATQDPGYLFS